VIPAPSADLRRRDPAFAGLVDRFNELSAISAAQQELIASLTKQRDVLSDAAHELHAENAALRVLVEAKARGVPTQAFEEREFARFMEAFRAWARRYWPQVLR
jgi:hypothetical protein